MTPYKAWDVFILHGDGVEHEIAYADSRNEAKYKVLNHECKTDGELANDPGIVAHVPKMSRKELNQALERKKRRSALLIAIDEKYGGVENAEGTWELKELRDMIGATEDGRKKKYED